MSMHDCTNIGPGFSDLALGSQAVFRRALQAFSEPGQPLATEHDDYVPDVGHGSAAFLLLALLDADCRLWLSPSLAASSTAAWLRFHTGCTLVKEPAMAHFAWVAHTDELPALHTFAQGSESDPDQSTTCVVDVQAMHPGHGWSLRGPGIREAVDLHVQGLPADFTSQWARNHAAFPCGVDVYLATPRQLLGLPRTTQISASLSQPLLQEH